MSEHWTFVSRGGATKKNLRNRNRKTAGGECPGLYQSANSFDIKPTHNGATRRDEHNIDESKDKERVEREVRECLHSLERQYQAREGFAFRLAEALVTATGVFPSKSEGTTLNLREIVVYGIGNFSHGPHSAPMLQLAGALLLRKLSAAYKHSDAINQCQEITTYFDNIAIHTSFRKDQQETPIFYYEPCILPLEKKLLEQVFHVHVLRGNDAGKLKVQDMRKQWYSIASPPAHSSTRNDRNRTHTLFYMPHCPMRLYCNILWAHWEHFVPSSSTRMQHEDTNHCLAQKVEQNDGQVSSNPIIIFGNSFHAYDERTISSEQRLDPTNGIFRLLPFANETPVCTDAENTNAGESLKMLERAFNDCNVISFSMNECSVPEKPEEYFPSEDPHENGELL